MTATTAPRSGFPARSLVVAPSWVGDTVMAWPVFEALAASGREVHVLARRHLVALARLHPGIAGAVERGDDRSTIAGLRAARFDEAILLPNSFHSAWLAWRAGIRWRWGYAGDGRRWLLRPAVPRPPRRPARHQREDYAGLLAALDVEAPADWTPRLDLDARTRQQGLARLERAGIVLDPASPNAARPLIGLFPGAEFGPSKRWPMERFAALARDLRRQLPSARCLIVAGPKEVWTAVRVHEESGHLHPVVGPDLDLAGLAAVLANLDLLVTNDSGPMHLAAALGVPTVALFGPTDPRRTAPSGHGHTVIDKELWCSPCFRRRCPLLHHRCMRSIAVEEVARAAVRSLG